MSDARINLPSGKVLDDFTVSTLADVAMIVPVTADERIVFVRQFKPGYGEVIMEFPSGRIETTELLYAAQYSSYNITVNK